MKKGAFMYEGKAKRLFETSVPDTVLIEYKDSFTAFNGEKKAIMGGKGRLNNLISAAIFDFLKDKGIPVHFHSLVDDIHQLVCKVKILPLEVVIRNITTGSICKRLGIKEGINLPSPLIEFYYKDDALGDPIVTEDHIILFEWASRNTIEAIRELALKVNQLLRDYFDPKGIVVVDFKLEFGKDMAGNLLLADEISPDTCRFWDKGSGERLDKDRFRKDMGDVLQAYEEIWHRIDTKN